MIYLFYCKYAKSINQRDFLQPANSFFEYVDSN